MWRAAAEQGEQVAQYNLGLRYANGRGVSRDDAEAVKWYRAVAGQGMQGRRRYSGCSMQAVVV
ncbi:hypothetical protein ACEUZ9_005388 [Paracoccus litorisediminis]|uniref:hypothetical protein n=1 Tax=Paracoccus litorisediminis TaxID=2006130 RepID=UPI003731D948